MSDLDQISKLLAARFNRAGERGRIVFWEDDKNAYINDVERLVGPSATVPELRDVELIPLNHNPFSARYSMFIKQPDTKFLVYLTSDEIKNPKDNWLLDLELAYGPVFTSDKLAVTATELVPDASPDTRAAWLEVMRRSPLFFEAKSRTEALAARLTATDDAQVFQAKMIAVLLKLKNDRHSLQDIWRELLTQYANDDDSGMESIEHMGLEEFHWAGTSRIYHYQAAEGVSPSVKDFMLWLFRLAWKGFVSGAAGTDTYANIRRDFESWRNERNFEATFKELSDTAADELDINNEIGHMDIEELQDRDVFRAVDDVLIHRMYERFSTGSLSAEQAERVIAARRTSLWYGDYQKEYQTIEAACRLRHELSAAPAVIDEITTPEQGFELYRDRLYRVDQAYRHVVAAWRQTEYDVPAIKDDLERAYAVFQRSLGQAWQKQLDFMDSWPVPNTPPQTEFYHRQVEPRIANGKKLAVIISDALRYEVAEEFAETMATENRYSTELSAQCGVLPSYTQLGMAALLPHSTLSFDPANHYGVLADGRSTSGTDNRNAILSEHDGRAILYRDFMELDRNQARDLVKSCSVLYIYHNSIDETGDAAVSERNTFDACQSAIADLVKAIKKLANANVSNMIVTADHGFLYQDHAVNDTEWLSEQPQGDAVWELHNRFVIGSNLQPKSAFLTLSAEQLGMTLTGEQDAGLTAQFPNSILRLRKPGSGVRYVHGGAALQEIVVPVVHINKGRSAEGDARPVEFNLPQKTDRITTGQLTVELVQDEPVEGRTLPRTVFVGLWGGDTLISNETPVALDMTSHQIAERHVTATLVLTSEADAYNGSTVELRVRERIKGTGQMKTLGKKSVYTLRRGLRFDDGFDFL